MNSRTYSLTGCELPQFYDSFQVNVIESGCYNVTSNNSVKTFYSIYKNNFSPLNPFENLVSQNDGTLNNSQFGLIAYLQSETTYVLVVATYETEGFSLIISGQNNVSLKHFSKYFDYSMNN
jgi:hypothetical protein